MNAKKRAIDYLEKNPGKKLHEIAKACNVSIGTVHDAKIALGLVIHRGEKRLNKTERVMEYIKTNPDQEIHRIVEACKVSTSTVTNARWGILNEARNKLKEETPEKAEENMDMTLNATQRVTNHIKNHPELSLREIATDCHVSTKTVQTVVAQILGIQRKSPKEDTKNKHLNKTERTIEYIKQNPYLSKIQIARNCDVSERTVQMAKTRLNNEDKSLPEISQTSKEDNVPLKRDSVEDLKQAVFLAGGPENLLQILNHVSSTGGIEHVAQQLKSYVTLKNIFE